ncbi:ribonuclease H-like domain-containing protein [Usnea florida]
MLSSFLKSPLLSNSWRLFSGAGAQRWTNKPRLNDPLVFIDCEMTGLDPERDTIMSIACFVTDAQLKLLDEQGWESFIHHDKSTLDRMDAWCTKTHGESGLTAACIASTTTSEQAAESLLEYIKNYVPEGRRGLLAGNSVHFDRAFLNKSPYTPIVDYLGYRILDVSSLKEAARRWAPEEVLLGVPAKKYLHQAKEDILESIEEARYYRETLFTK